MKNKMKIGLVCKGPDYIHQQKWAKILSKFSEVKFIYPKNPPKNIILKLFYYLFFIREVREEAKDCDFIFSLSFFPHGIFAAFSEKKFLVMAFGSDILIQSKKIIFHYLAKMILKRASLVAINSIVVRREITKLDCPSEKIIKIIPTPLVKKINIKKISNSIIFARDDRKICNHHVFKKAIKIVKRKYPKIYVTHIKGRPYSYDEFADILSKHQIYVSANSSDSMSPTLLEAMFYGLVPVCSHIESYKEVIIDGYNGFLFITENHNDMAEKLLYLLNNPDLINKFGKRSKDIMNNIVMKIKPEKILEQKIKMELKK